MTHDEPTADSPTITLTDDERAAYERLANRPDRPLYPFAAALLELAEPAPAGGDGP